MKNYEHIEHDCYELLKKDEPLYEPLGRIPFCFRYGKLCKYKNPNDCEFYKNMKEKQIEEDKRIEGVFKGG